MNAKRKNDPNLLKSLQERAKELDCLYKIEELLSDSDITIDELFDGIVSIIPFAWQYPTVCQAQLTFNEQIYRSAGFKESPWQQRSPIIIGAFTYGEIEVSYTKLPNPKEEEDPFLKEEKKLLDTISTRLASTMGSRFSHLLAHTKDTESENLPEWKVLMNFLERSDKLLFRRVCHKLLHFLCWNGIHDAKLVLESSSELHSNIQTTDHNFPLKKEKHDYILALAPKIMDLAAKNFKSELILQNIQKWIQEDKSRESIKAIDNPHSTIREIVNAVSRYNKLEHDGLQLSESLRKGLCVSLIRRFFSNQLQYINIAKNFMQVSDFFTMVKHVIYLPESYGKLGGKSAGLLLAQRILEQSPQNEKLFKNVKVPKTWFITSDVLINFVYHNNLEDLIEQKYKELDEIALEYPNIVQIFKNSQFPTEIIKGLESAIDDIGEKPVIVRSSSLLEDSLGAAFSGKYKSLFLANQGTKQQRLEALLDAVAEVYASMFSPDPIEYRTERGLLDFPEEMGIMIQEVVGTTVGDYFFPLCAGVAFSNNEFRWSPRIKREDGLIRLVPGLGTRAVDRLSDDYPLLVAPSDPQLRVNVTPAETIHYSPHKIDVINLKENSFRTVDVAEILKKYGDEIPSVTHLISIINGEYIHHPTSTLNIDFDRDQLVVTFEGLIKQTKFIEQIREMLSILKSNIQTPVDIEFAHDGTDLYLLQCRPQSNFQESGIVSIPYIPEKSLLFSASKYISNGYIPAIDYIVYVDPGEYSKISSIETMKEVGRAVGKLNKILPKRRFILMGPGRWGSRGDIRLGVNIGYSDINNTAALIEIARKKGNYTPDLSFGTHFFQDLVEADIRYIPLYPDEENNVFQESFFIDSGNMLNEILPEYSHLIDVLHVIDVAQTSPGNILRIIMNPEEDKAVAYITEESTELMSVQTDDLSAPQSSDDHSRWRLHIAKKIAHLLEKDRFAVENLYIFGSTKNGTATARSDINLLVHFRGNDEQREKLLFWLEGWSTSLAEINYLRTGYRLNSLLDIHIITDLDISLQKGLAEKINAPTDAARLLTQ